MIWLSSHLPHFPECQSSIPPTNVLTAFRLHLAYSPQLMIWTITQQIGEVCCEMMACATYVWERIIYGGNLNILVSHDPVFPPSDFSICSSSPRPLPLLSLSLHPVLYVSHPFLFSSFLFSLDSASPIFFSPPSSLLISSIPVFTLSFSPPIALGKPFHWMSEVVFIQWTSVASSVDEKELSGGWLRNNKDIV